MAFYCMAVRYFVLHQFFGPEGIHPRSGLVVDAAGNLYGTTTLGGHLNCTTVGLPDGCGTVFKEALVGNRWTETVLYAFNKADGAYPVGGLVFDTIGNLYGTTSSGGDLSCVPLDAALYSSSLRIQRKLDGERAAQLHLQRWTGSGR
jgi:hypothetical protein